MKIKSKILFAKLSGFNSKRYWNLKVRDQSFGFNTKFESERLKLPNNTVFFISVKLEKNYMGFNELKIYKYLFNPSIFIFVKHSLVIF